MYELFCLCGHWGRPTDAWASVGLCPGKHHVKTSIQFKTELRAVLQVCLTFVANNLSQVISTEEYKRLTETCSTMVGEILQAVAAQGPSGLSRGGRGGASANGAAAAAGCTPAAGTGAAAPGTRALRAVRRRDEDRMVE